MELFQKKKEVVQGKSKFFTLTNKQKCQGIYGLVDPPSRVKCIAKIGMKACTQSSRHLFPELFATDKPNYVTLSYKYSAGIQHE